jgi:hypothetical protein
VPVRLRLIVIALLFRENRILSRLDSIHARLTDSIPSLRGRDDTGISSEIVQGM